LIGEVVGRQRPKRDTVSPVSVSHHSVLFFWGVVKGTPGVTGFVGASQEPVALTQVEVDRLLHKEVATAPRTRAQFTIGETVKVVSGPLSDFSGEISEINDDAAKLKVLVSIFGRETPVEVGFDQVKKL
jgi:transcriptional antiterminator NusG